MYYRQRLSWWLCLVAFLLVGCRTEQRTEAIALDLSELGAVSLGDGEKLRVVATTSIIGDVVSQVGGAAIELTTLIPPGQDPHSFEPTPADLARAAEAHVIFVNGWNLEEGLASDLETIATDAAAIVPVSANVEPLETDQSHEDEEPGDEGEHTGPDPHTWFDVQNAIQWVDNIETTLGAADPANAGVYAANAAAYTAELEELDAAIRAGAREIPADNRQLITNHDNFGYFARAYGFDVVGVIIPGGGTLAEPSAGDVVALIDVMRREGVCTIFTETVAADTLAQTVAGELTDCPAVKVLTLHTDALGPAGSGADTYIGMMQVNMQTLSEGLKE